MASVTDHRIDGRRWRCRITVSMEADVVAMPLTLLLPETWPFCY